MTHRPSETGLYTLTMGWIFSYRTPVYPRHSVDRPFGWWRGTVRGRRVITNRFLQRMTSATGLLEQHMGRNQRNLYCHDWFRDRRWLPR